MSLQWAAELLQVDVGTLTALVENESVRTSAPRFHQWCVDHMPVSPDYESDDEEEQKVEKEDGAASDSDTEKDGETAEKDENKADAAGMDAAADAGDDPQHKQEQGVAMGDGAGI